MKYNSMDTAPKDGTEILVWNLESYGNEAVGTWMHVSWVKDWVNYPGSKPVFRWCQIGSWQDEQGGYTTADNPVCWTPLPKPPLGNEG